ncbi:MAG: hypothetical protein EZS28_047400, partial [Streblomastix strix]
MDVLIKNVSISVIDNVLYNSIEKLYRVNKDFVHQLIWLLAYVLPPWREDEMKLKRKIIFKRPPKPKPKQEEPKPDTTEPPPKSPTIPKSDDKTYNFVLVIKHPEKKIDKPPTLATL